MTTRPPYNPDPPSEQSIYYDAPLMHFFSSKKNSASDNTSNRAEKDQPAQNGNVQNSGAAPVPADNANVQSRDYGVPTAEASAPTAQPYTQAKGTSMSNDADYDSGYASVTGANRPRPHSPPRVSERSIPIVWNGEESVPNEDRQGPTRGRDKQDGAAVQRATSMRSSRSGRSMERASSIAPTTYSERRRRVSLSGGSFANGAGTVGPSASPPMDEELRQRNARTDSLLSPKEKTKIDKAQKGSIKRISKIIKAESKSEQVALDAAIAELGRIQNMQKTAVKDEAKATDAHGRALKMYHKAESEFLAAKVKFEKAQAELEAYENAREAARAHAQEITDMLQEKNREVEHLREQKIVDDRERAVKIKDLSGKT